MPEFPYDVIPPGKKPVKSPTTGEWTLVDLNAKIEADLEVLFEDLKAKHYQLVEGFAELKALCEKQAEELRILKKKK